MTMGEVEETLGCGGTAPLRVSGRTTQFVLLQDEGEIRFGSRGAIGYRDGVVEAIDRRVIPYRSEFW
ncbi:MAG: hypothetical protein AAF376_06865 [Pseudomonadota bacterium]